MACHEVLLQGLLEGMEVTPPNKFFLVDVIPNRPELLPTSFLSFSCFIFLRFNAHDEIPNKPEFTSVLISCFFAFTCWSGSPNLRGQW